MQYKKSFTMLLVLVLITMALPVAVQGDSPAVESSVISITDSRGVTTNLTQPATHVAAFGAFATNTLVDIGFLETAVIFDASSEYNKSAIPEMMNMSQDKFVTVSSSNKDAVVQKMLDLADDGIWNKTTDVIFGYGYSYLNPVWTELEGYGFQIITFYPDSYDGIVQVVMDIETVVGADHQVSEQMGYVKTHIMETLADNGITNSTVQVHALYASYSSNTLKLGNNGSVTVDFIASAGGFNVAEDGLKSTPTYTADFSAILQMNPDIVLLDGYYVGTVDDFSALIGNSDIEVFKLNKSWNSYCPDATDGLWTIASLFYPDYFVGEMPTVPEEEKVDNTLLYAAIGAIVVVGAVAVVLAMRRNDRKG